MTADIDVKTTSALKVLVADEDESALKRMSGLIEGLGHEVVAHVLDLTDAIQAIADDDPDVSIVLVHSDDQHALSLIEEIKAFSAGPIIVLLGIDDQQFVTAAAERGIAAFVRPTSPEAVQSTIEVALRRHEETAHLNKQVAQLQTALDRRVIIERAKGILMERYSLSDRDAFELLRSNARASNKTVVALADEVADGLDLSPIP